MAVDPVGAVIIQALTVVEDLDLSGGPAVSVNLDVLGRGSPVGSVDTSLNGRPVLALVHDLETTILDATTGETLRELTLDTTRRYQPQTPRNPRT